VHSLNPDHFHKFEKYVILKFVMTVAGRKSCRRWPWANQVSFVRANGLSRSEVHSNSVTQ